MNKVLHLIGIGILGTIVSLLSLQYVPIINYSITFIVSSMLYLLFASLLLKYDVDKEIIFTFVVFSIVTRGAFITTTPIGSDDIYRYMWDGKVQSASINPYRFAPTAPELQSLTSANLPHRVNHADMKTMYFPLSEWIFFLGYELSGEQVWGYKFLLLLSECISIYGIVLILQQLKINRKYILLYALCPMIIYEYAVDAHVDGFGLPLLIFAIYFYIRNRKLLGLFFLGMSLSIKPVGLVLLPVLFFEEKGWRNKMAVLVVPFVILGVQFFPYMFSADPFESLGAFAVNWTFNGFVFNILNSIMHDNQLARTACAVILLIVVLALSMTKKPLLDRLYYAVLFLLLLSPIVHPWYVGWLAVMLPVVRKWSGLVFVSTLCLTSFTYISYQLNGQWKEEPIQWLVEYIPVVILMLLELGNRTRMFFPERPFEQ